MVSCPVDQPWKPFKLKCQPWVTSEKSRHQKEAVTRLKFEMQRLELEQQLEDMRERMARDKKSRQQNVAHEQWVTEQKRNLQAIKIEKAREPLAHTWTAYD